MKGQDNFDLESISPIKAVGKIGIPILIAHGSDDTNVPASQSTILHAALTKAGKPHDYFIYPDEGHSPSKVENSVDFLKRTEAFLAGHNPAQ